MPSSLQAYIEEIQKLTTPKSVVICEGTKKEYQTLLEELEKTGTIHSLKKRPGSYLTRTAPDDVARLEEATFICSKTKEDAGPTNRWVDPDKMRARLHKAFSGCMRGRTMYVIPYLMGPYGSQYSRLGIEITDSPYVVVNMYLMTRMGKQALHAIENGEPFVKGVHSVGKPLEEGEKDISWPCNPDKMIAHFPETKEIWSFGSGYGGNALLGKKCFALRLASKMGLEEGFLAEHMLIIGVTNPQGKKRYFAAAFPSSCGKTNLALLQMQIPGWKVECVGDDIAWFHIGDDERLYAINPEQGFFGVAPGTSQEVNPNAMATITKDTLFTNVAETLDGDVWWEGMTKEAPLELIDWKGRPWKRGSNELAAHPNARFTVSIRQCPVFDPKADDPKGVPIDAILFGGRRSSLSPLLVEALDFTHGVFLGASLSSERTAAAEGCVGELRHDPFAMLPFCGYHMGDYFSHWLSFKEKKMPRIYGVNWFRKDEKGNFYWPGYSENGRILQWIFERLDGKKDVEETPIGCLPKGETFGLDKRTYENLFSIDKDAYHKESHELKEYFSLFGDRFPQALWEKWKRLDESFSPAGPTR